MEKKKWIFRLLAVALPFVLLLGIEGVLRMASVGYNPDLFVADPDNPDYLVMNREVSKKYFSLHQNATIGNTEPFLKEKRPNTLRFFVLGASSSLGFPYMHNGSFARMLKYKLQFGYPQYHVEVINLSLTAVNSFTLNDFARQLIKHHPDGVLIYAGHNEYYGAMGAASYGHPMRPGFLQASIRAQEWRLVQALTALKARMQDVDSVRIDSTHTLMERMAYRQMVPLHSTVYEAGIAQYRYNMESMLHLFGRHGIPVLIGTLASNLRGQSPLDKAAPTVQLYNQGLDALTQHKKDIALDLLTDAKDADALRFRAPEAFNEMIRSWAQTMPHVHLVDIEKALSQASPDGIIGNELMLEHVHPNLYGHRLMAEAYNEVLRSTCLANKSKQGGMEVDLAQYPTTAFDTICGCLAIHQLKQQWPFNEAPKDLGCDSTSFEFKVAVQFCTQRIHWGEAMQRLNNYYITRKDYASALRIVEQMCLELPYTRMFFKQAASLSQRLGREEKAEFYQSVSR